ncbi:hypothetical protein FSP39_000122 [Pinctada imbricata]|uniref:Probable D-lactate dehydrogenase, mitochondrial n=1 Tax=Pinctada imbricata TaxID=66713 RepID=A0AA88XLV1_PINIB|nr:hypothetical protein FSP39_000122 [Pinctada imbricata]
MPGEQLTCVLQAVSAVAGQKEGNSGTGIPKLVLNCVIHSLQRLKSVNLPNDAFRQYFSEKEKVTFENLKFFICNNLCAKNADIKDLCDEIESACWNICKGTVSAPLKTTNLEKLWRVANRLTDENMYPPKIAKGECTWFMTKLTVMLGNEWLSKEIAVPDSDLSVQEFLGFSFQNYFCNLSRDKVEHIIDGLHCWLVDETLKSGWIYKRSRKQANWTSWVKRWCVLTPTKIEFFKRGKAIDFVEVKRQTKMESLAPYQGIIQAHKFRFKVSNYPISECELNAETESDKILWMSCLDDAINAAKENTTPVQKLLKRRRNYGNQANRAEKELDRMFQKTVRHRMSIPTITVEGKVVPNKDKHDVIFPETKFEERELSNSFLEQERQKLKAIFLKIDKDGNGILSREEFSDFVKTLGLKMAENEIDLVFNTCDKDKSGQVTYDEFQQYFAQHILGETGNGKCVAGLRRAFLKADRDGSGTLTFKEFTEYIWDRKRSVRISSLLDIFGKMGKNDTEEVCFNDFQEFLLKEQTYLPMIEEEIKDGKSFENHLKCAFDQTEALAERFIPVTDSLVQSLAAIVGDKNVSTAGAVRDQHGHDESYHSSSPPEVVAFASSVDEVSAVARLCNEKRVPLIPFGSGTGLEGGINAIKGGVCLDVMNMNKILSVHPEDFDCQVECGVTRVTLNNYLRDTGLWFPIDPGADASLCGMCSTSASGTNAVRYGTMRENVLNLEVVLPDGRVIDTAGKGRRTKKTSAGYNLTNLFVGSEGTLGIITKATLKLSGIPEATVSAVCCFDSVQAAVDTTVQVLQCGIPMARIEFLDEVSVDACNRYSNLDNKVAPSLFLEFTGSPNTLDEQAELVNDIAKMNGGSDFKWAKDPDVRNHLWKARHDILYACMALRPGCKPYSTDVCVPISNLPEVVVRSKKFIDEAGVVGPIVGHVGDGNFHVFFPVDQSDPEDVKKVHDVSHKMALLAQELDGTCTGEHGIGMGKRELLVREIGEDGIEVMKEVKKTFDPNGIMNPGKVFC